MGAFFEIGKLFIVSKLEVRILGHLNGNLSSQENLPQAKLSLQQVGYVSQEDRDDVSPANLIATLPR